MKKKGLIIGILIVLFFLGYPVYQYCSIPDGSTVESREELLKDIPKGTGWKIAVEQSLEDYLVCGTYSTDDKIGIAVFEPVGNGKYKLFSREWRPFDEVIISGVMIAGKWYDIVWFNGATTSYAELTYTYGGKTEKLTFDTEKAQIICNPCDAKEYTLRAVYYDSEGKVYE